MTRSLLNYLPPLITLVLSAALLLSSEKTQNLLIFDRQLIQQGELWRLVTCNFLHTNWSHLVINCLGLYLIWSLFIHAAKQIWMHAFFCFPTIITTIFLFFWSPELKLYVGFSGALHGVIFALALASLKKQRLLAGIVLLSFSIKIIYEQIYGASASVSQLIEADVAIDAHLFGALSGILLGSAFLFQQKLTEPIH